MAIFFLRHVMIILQGTVIKLISDIPLSLGSGGQEPDLDFLYGYLIFIWQYMGHIVSISPY